MTEVIQPDGHFADLNLGHAENLGGVLDMEVAIPAAWSRGTLQDAGHDKLLAIDGSVHVSRHHDNGVSHFDFQSLRQEGGDHDLTPAQGFLALRDAGCQQGNGLEFPIGIDAVQADVRRLSKVAEHAAELEAGREGLDFRRRPENLRDLLIGFRFDIQIERQIVDGGDVTFPVDLEVSQHGVGDLADHHGFEGAGDRSENQDEDDADGDQ